MGDDIAEHMTTAVGKVTVVGRKTARGGPRGNFEVEGDRKQG